MGGVRGGHGVEETWKYGVLECLTKEEAHQYRFQRARSDAVWMPFLNTIVR